jgi:hypothetical protein
MQRTSKPGSLFGYKKEKLQGGIIRPKDDKKNNRVLNKQQGQKNKQKQIKTNHKAQ